MNTPENDSLERILRGMNSAQPGPHMQTRLLAKLEAQRTKSAKKNLWRALAPISVSALALLAVTIFAVKHRTIQAPTFAQVPVAVPRLPAPAAMFRTRVATHILASPHKTYVVAADHTSVEVGRTEVPRPDTLDQIGAVEMRLPSLPEQVPPLSSEERVLQRSVQHGVELAELTPAAREAAYMLDRDDFQHFFAPRPLVIIPPPADTNDPSPSGDHDHEPTP